MNILPVIRELLLHNRKAVIPGLGAFEIVQRPAQLNKITGVLSPPSITVKFDRNQQSDDGKISGYLTQKLKLGDEVVLKAISDFRKDIEEKLTVNNPVVLKGFGILSVKSSGKTGFEPAEELLKRISLAELPEINISAKPAEKITTPPVEQKPVPPPVEQKPVLLPAEPEPVPPAAEQKPVIPPAEQKPVTPPIEKVYVPPVAEKIPVRPVDKPAASPYVTDNYPENTYERRSRWWIPASLLALLAILLAAVYFTGNMNILVSDVKKTLGIKDDAVPQQLVFGKSADSSESDSDANHDEISRELDRQVDREAALAYTEEEKEAVASRRVLPVPPQAGQAVTKPYHIIAGSFTIEQNALRQKASLEQIGISAEILPRQGNYYMVSLGSYNTREEASTAMKRMMQTLPKELWVMRYKGE